MNPKANKDEWYERIQKFLLRVPRVKYTNESYVGCTTTPPEMYFYLWNDTKRTTALYNSASIRRLQLIRYISRNDICIIQYRSWRSAARMWFRGQVGE
jgi:hypothetical protein